MDLREINLISMILRIGLAILLGGILGVERGHKNRPAGMRTHMLVCTGSALVMMTNQYAYQYFQISDPMRLGAQVVSGIGFLGAGVIIVNGRGQIKGITTAAGLWASACIGLAIGIGFYEGALLGGGAILLIIVFLQRVDTFILNRSGLLNVYIEYDVKYTLHQLLDELRESGFSILDLQLQKKSLVEKNTASIILEVKSNTRETRTEMIEKISTIKGIKYIDEM